MTDAYYRRLRTDGEFEVFESTGATCSNWDAGIQHGSPPLALMTKLIEESAPPGQRIGRLVMDILGAIPVVPLRVRTWVERPGARISLRAAEMAAQRPDGSWRAVARLSAWLLATSDTGDVATDRHRPLREGPARGDPHPWHGAPGYLDSIDWRRQHTPDGADAEAWLSPLVKIVDADDTTALQRLAMVVDSANGIGAVLDPARFVFMNTDTALHLHRLPVGADFGLRSRASIGPDGVGATTTEVFDRQGFVGTCAQTLLVQRVS
ncbi:thioesterase family protein [Mycolicibacterium thermoresistibile]